MIKLNRRWATIALAVLCGALFGPAQASNLERDANKAFRKIGVSEAQMPRYAEAFETFLRKRNLAVRRVLNANSGDVVPVLAKKRARRAARKSVKQMRGILTEEQIPYYEAYLEAANKVFLYNAGLK
ncbi:MAG: hypothetical protein AAF513_09290 [Pseudomonadota bacterium]